MFDESLAIAWQRTQLDAHHAERARYRAKAGARNQRVVNGFVI
jgi:hypothetical protein